MQIQMLVYSTMDVFQDKAQIITDKAKTMQQKQDKEKGLDPKLNEREDDTYLGLLIQTFVDRFEIDVYGLISITNFKYVVAKIEKRLNPVGNNNAERHIRDIFERIQNLHTCMLLNPFFDFDRTIWNGIILGGSSSILGSYKSKSHTQARLLDEDEDSDYSSSSCSSTSSNNNEQTSATQKSGQSQAGQPLNSKLINKENVDKLASRIDTYISAADNKLRNTF